MRTETNKIAIGLQTQGMTSYLRGLTGLTFALKDVPEAHTITSNDEFTAFSVISYIAYCEQNAIDSSDRKHAFKSILQDFKGSLAQRPWPNVALAKLCMAIVGIQFIVTNQGPSYEGNQYLIADVDAVQEKLQIEV